MKPSAGNFVTMNINERMALTFLTLHVMLDSVPPCYVTDFELYFITFLNHETI
jgi:hypothetical protein